MDTFDPKIYLTFLKYLIITASAMKLFEFLRDKTKVKIILKTAIETNSEKQQSQQ